MSQKKRLFEPMSMAAYDDNRVRKWARAVEKRECVRSGVNDPDARKILARRWGVSFWTLTNWHRGRLKDLRGSIRDRIQAGVLAELEAEIERLSHERDMAAQCFAGTYQNEMAEMEVALSQARGIAVEGQGDLK